MPTTIEIEISPLNEAREALIESIKEYFLIDVDDKFIPDFIDADIYNYFEQLDPDTYCLIEYPYVDKVYRDSFYTYYSSKHFSYQRDCIRVSLFNSEITNDEFLKPELHENLKKKYLGYFILRPTVNALFGRSMINPAAFIENEFKICSCNSVSFVNGVKMETRGFPHSSQDEETIKCAETTVWALMEYFGNKYADYRPTLPSKIHEALERFSYQRQLPSTGLTMDQISFALKSFGFGSRIYSKDSYGDEIYGIIDCYIESGIPVIIGLQSADVGHVVIAVGKEDMQKIDWGTVLKTDIDFDGTPKKFFDSSHIDSKYVIQDDNMEPYKLISLDAPGEHYAGDKDCEDYQIDAIVVPLYPKIYLEVVVAKGLILQIVSDKIFGFSFEDNFVFRFYLASSRSFKSHISDSNISDDLKSSILLTKMPKFIWCAEFYDTNEYDKEDERAREANGLIILDATQANNQSIDAIIFAGYPDRCISMVENNFVLLPYKFENYTYYCNLN